MERNRWEIAIRCLEVALHPHTSDQEVLAGVNGFRRTANGRTLSDVCAAFVGKETDGDAARWRGKIERLTRENLELRRKLDVTESERLAALGRLQAAEQRVRDLKEELRAAQIRVGEVEAKYADLRAAYGEMSGRRTVAQPAAERTTRATTPPPFQDLLAAARQRAGEVGSAGQRTPWTA